MAATPSWRAGWPYHISLIPIGCRAAPEGSDFEIDDLRLQLSAGQGQAPHRHRQAEPPRPRAAGIEIEHPVLGLDPGLVGMPGNDRAKAGRAGIAVQRIEIVQDVETAILDLN